MPAFNTLAQLLLIIGGLNWGLIGLFEFDLVKAIFGGTMGLQSGLSRIIYVLVGLAALYGCLLLATPTSASNMRDHRGT